MIGVNIIAEFRIIYSLVIGVIVLLAAYRVYKLSQAYVIRVIVGLLIVTGLQRIFAAWLFSYTWGTYKVVLTLWGVRTSVLFVVGDLIEAFPLLILSLSLLGILPIRFNIKLNRAIRLVLRELE